MACDGALAKLEAATSWDARSLKELTGPDGFNLRAADLKTEIALRRIEACLQLSKRLGVSVTHLFAWAQDDPNAIQAEQVKSAVKAKYDDAQWLTVAKGLNDGFREMQRSALIAYIIKLPVIIAAGVRDSNQLFEYFLIDVEMSACMATSRIRQAISSVQLFVQRCFMNLEPNVRPNSLSARHWKWMKNYPGVGSQPQGLSLPGELDRARAARRQESSLQGTGKRTAAKRGDPGYG